MSRARGSWAVWIAAAILAAGCYRSTTPPPEPPKREPAPSAARPGDRRATPARARREPRAERDPESAQVIADLTAFRDAVCACTDKACADQVMKDLEAWAQAQPQGSKARKPSEAAMKELTELTGALAECITKLMQQQQPPPAP